MARLTQDAMDSALNGLLQWGLGGAILAVFVAPTFLWMMRSTQKRQEEADKREAEERKARMEREAKLVDNLAASVAQQGEALTHWREAQAREDEVHRQMTTNLGEVTKSLGQHLETQTRVIQLLDRLGDKLDRKGG